MKITNKTLVDSVESLNKIVELSLPVKTAFKIVKATKIVESSLVAYNEVLAKIQDEHILKDEAGEPVTKAHPTNPDLKQLVFEDVAAYHKAVAELHEIEVELALKPLKIDSLGAVEIKPTALYNLSWLFV